jgi:hypothetical protein
MIYLAFAFSFFAYVGFASVDDAHGAFKEVLAPINEDKD